MLQGVLIAPSVFLLQECATAAQSFPMSVCQGSTLSEVQMTEISSHGGNGGFRDSMELFPY